MLAYSVTTCLPKVYKIWVAPVKCNTSFDLVAFMHITVSHDYRVRFVPGLPEASLIKSLRMAVKAMKKMEDPLSRVQFDGVAP
ncbi:hypothetical protein L1987_13424 [Smallanthus sonchifolius]|uniref:Uncharacterized protein n=1 Tax=Smallanthus sonchifolius TaxID=185202 RepID=A0ACB9JI13_9ASTR|nr:hypothetical protein L1987_13424 [Smallanthus sonchifolius]